MTQTYGEAARLPQTDRDQSAAVAEAEGRAAMAVLEKLGDDDWHRPTDCVEWDVRTLVSHLVAQCEDNISLATMARREITGRRRHPGMGPVDAHMAAQIADHTTASGPELTKRFGLLWPRAARARRRRPGLLRRARIDTGVAAAPRMSVGHLLDTVYNRDLWMHRIDLTRATGQSLVVGEHDRLIVEQVIRDLALAWSGAPVALELTGPAGGAWLLGSGEPASVVRADAVACLRALAGRDPDVPLELVRGADTALAAVRRARVVF
ncbi:maleylpyruvate isomerase family mycothiol-dependent enzyme [Streptomyces sp. NPDC058451]|uniref:maleylpyruvate isomerase family mycothiol-dependent enzyme n=1 Tax=Streptomyces sp. NPDC058451 TaxID=3346506 RepID=UPI00365FCEA0